MNGRAWPQTLGSHVIFFDYVASVDQPLVAYANACRLSDGMLVPGPGLAVAERNRVNCVVRVIDLSIRLLPHSFHVQLLAVLLAHSIALCASKHDAGEVEVGGARRGVLLIRLGTREAFHATEVSLAVSRLVQTD